MKCGDEAVKQHFTSIEAVTLTAAVTFNFSGCIRTFKVISILLGFILESFDCSLAVAVTRSHRDSWSFSCLWHLRVFDFKTYPWYKTQSFSLPGVTHFFLKCLSAFLTVWMLRPKTDHKYWSYIDILWTIIKSVIIFFLVCLCTTKTDHQRSLFARHLKSCPRCYFGLYSDNTLKKCRIKASIHRPENIRGFSRLLREQYKIKFFHVKNGERGCWCEVSDALIGLCAQTHHCP